MRSLLSGRASRGAGGIAQNDSEWIASLLRSAPKTPTFNLSFTKLKPPLR